MVVVAFIRFPADQADTAKTEMNTVTGHGGKPIGVGRKIETIEGNFPSDQAIAMVEFDSMATAEKWAVNDEKVKNWDVMAAEVKNKPTSGNKCVQMVDVEIKDEARFLSEYVPGHIQALKAAGADTEIVCTKDVRKLAGNGSPHFLVVHGWKDNDAFHSWYKSGDSAQLEGLRKEVTTGSVIIFSLE